MGSGGGAATPSRRRSYIERDPTLKSLGPNPQQRSGARRHDIEKHANPYLSTKILGDNAEA